MPSPRSLRAVVLLAARQAQQHVHFARHVHGQALHAGHGPYS